MNPLACLQQASQWLTHTAKHKLWQFLGCLCSQSWHSSGSSFWDCPAYESFYLQTLLCVVWLRNTGGFPKMWDYFITVWGIPIMISRQGKMIIQYNHPLWFISGNTNKCKVLAFVINQVTILEMDGIIYRKI